METMANELYDLSTTQEIIDCRGAKPKPLQSTWMMRDRITAPDRVPVTVFFIDDNVSETTLTRCKDMETAVTCLHKLMDEGRDVYIRPHVIDEKSLASEAKDRRQVRQFGQ